VTKTEETTTHGSKSLVMHSEARYYDLQSWLLTLGRERAFRERLVDLARMEPGDAVLDVGCGTGTLAIAAKRRVGAPGTVIGMDASPEMIERAQRKAAKAGSDVAFRTGTVEALPFPDAQFDVVLSTLMLHHLPRPLRRQCARVLKPGGRVLAVDFATPAKERKGLLPRLHRHGHLALRDIVGLLSEAELTVVENGSVGVGDLHFAVATAPSRPGDERHDRRTHTSRSLDPLPAPRWILPVLGAALVTGHGIVLRVAPSRLAPSAVAVTLIAGLLVTTHLGLARGVHTLFRRRTRP
jgi:ubiquinone/menaquinone biosynthesis C-methylase UbiE